jgi:hypothetical protein
MGLCLACGLQAQSHGAARETKFREENKIMAQSNPVLQQSWLRAAQRAAEIARRCADAAVGSMDGAGARLNALEDAHLNCMDVVESVAHARRLQGRRWAGKTVADTEAALHALQAMEAACAAVHTAYCLAQGVVDDAVEATWEHPGDPAAQEAAAGAIARDVMAMIQVVSLACRAAHAADRATRISNALSQAWA